MFVVVTDYDGTITLKDGFSEAFDVYMGFEQKLHSEDLVRRNIIQSHEQIQMGLDCMPLEAVRKIIWPDKCSIDPSFEVFYNCLETQMIPCYILSSGIKTCIRNALPFFPEGNIYANDISFTPDSCCIVPYQSTGVDKKGIIENIRAKHPDIPIIYFGDGFSDLPVVGKTELIFVKRNKYLHDYCLRADKFHVAFDSFEDIYSLFFSKKILHIHFGFGNLTCGALLNSFEKTKNSHDIIVVRKKRIDFKKHFVVYSREDAEVVLYPISNYLSRFMHIACIDDIMPILHILKQFRSVEVSTAVGYANFHHVYNLICKYLNYNQTIFAFENFLLQSDIQLANVKMSIADRVCIQTVNEDHAMYVKRVVLTEKYQGQVLVPEGIICLEPQSTETIRCYSVLKNFVSNYLHILVALYATQDKFDFHTVLSKNNKILSKLLILACQFIYKTRSIPMDVALDFAQNVIKRFKDCPADSKARVLRNLHVKWREIFRPILQFHFPCYIVNGQ